MDFEYNGNLLEDDRIKLVSNEIISKYPQVSVEKAREAAMLEGRISSDKTVEDELNRLYNIMLVNSDNKDIVSIIYKDFLNLLESNSFEEDSIYMALTNSINNYLKNDDEFPFMSDYE